MNENKIGLKIKELRTNKGWSQNELAEKVYSTKSTISKWENGEIVPSIDVLKIIAKALGVNLYKILGDKTPISNLIFNVIGKFLIWIFVWVHIDITFVGVTMAIALAFGVTAVFGGLGWFITDLISNIMNHHDSIEKIIINIGIFLWIPIVFVIFGFVAFFIYVPSRSVHIFSRRYFWRSTKASFTLKEFHWVKKMNKMHKIIILITMSINVISLVVIMSIFGSTHSMKELRELFNIRF